MRVVFLEDVAGVAQGGDVKDVKRGFARNYLIPKKLAAPATRDALRHVGHLTRGAEVKRLKTLSDMKAVAEELDGVRVDVEMRAGASGRLYGSVTNAVVASALSELAGREIDRRTIEIPEPIRQVGSFDLRLRLHADVQATISVLVYPMGTDPEEFLSTTAEQKEEAVAEVAEAEDVVEVEAVAEVAEAEDVVEVEAVAEVAKAEDVVEVEAVAEVAEAEDVVEVEAVAEVAEAEDVVEVEAAPGDIEPTEGEAASADGEAAKGQ
jgi:large subunit ribosomal protein L9